MLVKVATDPQETLLFASGSPETENGKLAINVIGEYTYIYGRKS